MKPGFIPLTRQLVILIIMQFIIFPLSGSSQIRRHEGVRRLTINDTVKPKNTVHTIEPIRNTVRIYKDPSDTIRLRGANIYILDQRKIEVFKTGLIKDSMKIPLANRQDMAVYQNAADSLKNILQEDPFQNAANYINLESELILSNTDNIPLVLNNANQYPISQLLLNQLTINIQMIRELVSNPMKEKSSIRLLDMLVENNKQLSEKTIFSMGNLAMMKHMVYPKLSVEVKDSTQAIIPSALGYLITNEVVRKVGFTFCDFTIKPCPTSDFNRIVTNTSQSYLKFAGSQVELVPFGKYHLFVSDGNAIYYVGSKRVNENNSSGEKITVQLY